MRYIDEVKAMSGPRCWSNWQGPDDINSVQITETGLRIRIADRGDRGRDHEVVVSYALIDHLSEDRHGYADIIARLHTEVATLEAKLAEIARLASPLAMDLLDQVLRRPDTVDRCQEPVP